MGWSSEGLPPIPAGDQPEPRREALQRLILNQLPGLDGDLTWNDAWLLADVILASLAAPTPEAAGLREWLLDAVGSLNGDDWRPDQDEPANSRGWVRLSAVESILAATPSQADRGLDAAVLDAVFAELNQRGWITVPDGHGVAAFRDVFIEAAARLRDSSEDSQRATEPLP